MAFLPCFAGDGDVAAYAVEFDVLFVPVASYALGFWCGSPDVESVA